MIFKDFFILSKYDNFFRISSEKTCQNAEPGFLHLWVSRQLSASVLAGDEESLHLADLRLQQERMEMSCFRFEGGQILS